MPSSGDLTELWQQILGSLELPSTRMLLSQQAHLVRLDANRVVVQVAGNWMSMVQSRSALLEQAVAKALGGNRQLLLEPGSGAVPPPAAAPPKPVVQPPAPVASVTPPPPAPVIAATTPRPAPETKPEPQAKPPEPTQTPPSNISETTQAQPVASSGLDRQAKNLADFFNGQVVDVETDGIT